VTGREGTEEGERLNCREFFSLPIMRGADGWAKNQLGERRLGELFFG